MISITKLDTQAASLL